MNRARAWRFRFLTAGSPPKICGVDSGNLRGFDRFNRRPLLFLSLSFFALTLPCLALSEVAVCQSVGK